jgi:hypothetical protein
LRLLSIVLVVVLLLPLVVVVVLPPSAAAAAGCAWVDEGRIQRRVAEAAEEDGRCWLGCWWWCNWKLRAHPARWRSAAPPISVLCLVLGGVRCDN